MEIGEENEVLGIIAESQQRRRRQLTVTIPGFALIVLGLLARHADLA